MLQSKNHQMTPHSFTQFVLYIGMQFVNNILPSSNQIPYSKACQMHSLQLTGRFINSILYLQIFQLGIEIHYCVFRHLYFSGRNTKQICPPRIPLCRLLFSYFRFPANAEKTRNQTRQGRRRQAWLEYS